MRVLGRSLKNAATATLAVVGAVIERRELTDQLSCDEAGPGELKLLTDAECLLLLQQQSVGRLAYIARQGTPDIVIVNYVFDGRDVLIRSGPGPKLQAAERGERVAFEVDLLDHEGRCGRSVVVHGTASRVAGGADVAPWAAGPRRHLIRIRPHRISGRAIS